MDRPALERLTPAAVQSWAGSENLNENRPKALPHERLPAAAALAPDLHGPGGAAVPLAWAAGQARGRGDEADGDAARSVARLFAGRRGAGAGDRREPGPRLRLHRQGQPRRGDLERHRDPRPRQPRRRRLEAGDGRQGGAVQALRRHRRLRSRGRHRGPGRGHQLRALPVADLRRRQPRGHQGAGVLHHRGAPTRAHGHPRLP